jgi:hypothetical protein
MPYGIAAYTGKLTLHGSKLQCQRSELGALTTFSKKLLAKKYWSDVVTANCLGILNLLKVHTNLTTVAVTDV